MPVMMKDAHVRQLSKERRADCVKALYGMAERESLEIPEIMTFRHLLEALPLTPREYETLLCASLCAPQSTPLRWQLIYQAAQQHGIQPTAYILSHKLAEHLSFSKPDQLMACLQILQTHHVSIEKGDEHGVTPLMHAFRLYPWQTLRLKENIDPWLKAGASLMTVDRYGNTFLHHAGHDLLEKQGFVRAIDSYSNSIHFLLQHGADVLACNRAGVPAHQAVRQRLAVNTMDRLSYRVQALVDDLERELDKAVLQQTLRPGAPSTTGRRRRV